MKIFITLGLTLICTGLAVATELRIGIIGCDTSHVKAFTELLNDSKAKGHVPGGRVVAAFKGGSSDITASASRAEQFAQILRDQHQVVFYDSIEQLCANVDAVLLESVDGRVHLEQIKPVLKARKPVFVDKPMAASLRDVIEIFGLAREANVPIWTSSSLRFGTNTQAVLSGSIGEVSAAETFSPCEVEPHHPELMWYGIHGVEVLFTVMGTGCETVQRKVMTNGAIEVIGSWNGGRAGIFRQDLARKYGGLARGERGEMTIGLNDGYTPLLTQIINFFQTGVAPVKPEETIELFAFMEAAAESKRTGGTVVKISDVMTQAMTTSVVFKTRFIDAEVSLEYPGFKGLSLDSLGKEHFPRVTVHPPANPGSPVQATRRDSRIEYRRLGGAVAALPRWAIEIATNNIQLQSHWSDDDPPEPLVLNVDKSACHVTLLGVMETNGNIRLPAILHFPGQGSFRISTESSAGAALGYAAAQGDLVHNQAKVVHLTFPAATRENPTVTYRWETVSIHPKISGVESDVRFDGFRRDWLSIFQLSPRWRMLANHATSDTCAFCYYEYADIALRTPPLTEGLTALDMVRQTLERIFNGATGYGMPGHGAYPEFSADTFPSLLIAAQDYLEGSRDAQWLETNYGKLKAWTEKMLATDRDSNGLLEYTLSGNSGSWPVRMKYRPSNWWDTIGFGHEDAYANALAYRAIRGMEKLARQSNHDADASRYRDAAEKLHTAYFKTFYNPITGVLAGWRSADGELHDYYFLWVNGIAIRYGLVPTAEANAIMDRLLAKMKEAGYTRFDLGLPGNLIPVARKDYVHLDPRWGGGKLEDNSDAFQIYENGGATACFAYFTLAALYELGRIEEGDRILFPMLDSFAKGDFQGRCSNGKSKDWRAWDGTCWGYEGFLVDNYYALLAVLDRERALRNGAR